MDTARSFADLLADKIESSPPPLTNALQPKQILAEELSLQADELLFGGAAGGGKTFWAMEHLISQCKQYPRNRVGLFRRVYPSIRDDVQPRLEERLRNEATWVAGAKHFLFPNQSKLMLGHMNNIDSWRRYAGIGFGCMCFEEVTEFLLVQYESLGAWCRVPPGGDPRIRPHRIATTNPGGVGHRWVKERFIRSMQGVQYPSMQVWTPDPTPEVPEPLSRAYIPSLFSDNIAGQRADPDYMRRLRGMISNRGLRRALEEGDWEAIDVIAGALWQYEWLDGGRVQPGYLDDHGALRRAVAADPSEGKERGDAFGLWAGGKATTGEIITTHSMPLRGSTKQMAQACIDVYYKTRADVMFIEKNHGGEWLKTVFLDIDPNLNIEMVWASDGKITRAEPIAALFEPDTQEDPHTYRARLEGYHVELETEFTSYTGKPGEPSPNILDAAVWGHKGLTEPVPVVHTHKDPYRRVMAGAPGKMRTR